MSSASTTRLPPLKHPYKTPRPSNRGKNNNRFKMTDSNKRNNPYSLMHLLSELPTINKKSSKQNTNNNKSSDAVSTEAVRNVKTPNEKAWNVYSERLPRTPRTPRTPKIREEPPVKLGSTNAREVKVSKEKKNSINTTKERVDKVNINNNNKVQTKSHRKVKGVTRPVVKTPVDIYLRPKTETEKSISRYVRLPPIQRAYTFAALRKHKEAAADFLSVLKSNYPRYGSKKNLASRSTSVLSLARSRSVISVGEHINRHTTSRLSRSRSVFELTKPRQTGRTTNRSRSVDPCPAKRARSRSRSRSRSRRIDKSANKRSRSVSNSRRSTSRPPLLPRPTRASLARSKSLITLASTRRQVPSRGAPKKSARRRTPSLPEIHRTLSHMSLISNANNNEDSPKKKKHSPLFVAIKPENQATEKNKFLKFPNYLYSPQFLYANPVSETQLAKYSKATDKFLEIAVKIMTNALERFGSYENYMEVTGGRKLGRFEIVQAAKQYLKKEHMENEVDIVLSEDLLSRARMSVMGGRPTVIIRAVNMRESWVDGMLRHEIGTHYIRAWNNKLQTWGKARVRKDMGLDPANPTEEGLASLHSVLFRQQPCLWRCALLYYTIYQATRLSFSDLFKDLGQFVKDPEVRWEYCIRAKRGYADTSQPGAFCKDQVYLTGALQILKHRNDIDFHLLVKCGKVSWRDLSRLELQQPELMRTRIPGFMTDLEAYRNELTRVLSQNGLSQEDLQYV